MPTPSVCQHLSDPSDFGLENWPRGSTGGTEVRVYPAECGEQLGRDPWKIGSSKSLVLKSFSGEGTLWDSSLPVSPPPLPLPQEKHLPAKVRNLTNEIMPALLTNTLQELVFVAQQGTWDISILKLYALGLKSQNFFVNQLLCRSKLHAKLPTSTRT